MPHSVHFNFRRKLHRRTVLRGLGVGIAVPWLSAMTESFAAPEAEAAPRRFVSMTLGLGLHADNLNPEGTGRDYTPSLYLQRLQDIRERVTVISGSSHPGVTGGHRAEASLLSAAPMGSGAASWNTVSLDQLMAKHLGDQTRFPSLVLGQSGSNSPSYTENGSMIPAESAAWVHRPKPKVSVPRPVDIGNPHDFVGRQRLMSDMVRLALSTDSSRFITFHLGGSGGVVPIEGVDEGYHSLSHHGLDTEKLEQLALVESEIVNAWGDFLRQLQQTDDSNGSLLDNTAVLLTSNLGNASSHDNRNMPVLVAGGRFQHGQHLAFERKNNYPLPNLYVSLLQHTGLEHDNFATSTGTMTGLEQA